MVTTIESTSTATQEAWRGFAPGLWQDFIAVRGFVQLDGVVLDRGSFELLRHALLHLARGLPDLEEPGMRRVRDGVGVDPWTCRRLGREDLLDGGLIHRRRPSGGSFD